MEYTQANSLIMNFQKWSIPGLCNQFSMDKNVYQMHSLGRKKSLKVEVKAWLLIFNFWLKCYFPPAGLILLIVTDQFQSSWYLLVLKKCALFGLSLSLLLSLEYNITCQMVKARLFDTKQQNELCLKHIKEHLKNPRWKSCRFSTTLISPTQQQSFFQNQT